MKFGWMKKKTGTSSSKKDPVPKYCPQGCGETITARPLTDQELERARLEGIALTKEGTWYVECDQCKYSTIIHNVTKRNEPKEDKKGETDK